MGSDQRDLVFLGIIGYVVTSFTMAIRPQWVARHIVLDFARNRLQVLRGKRLEIERELPPRS
jgi:hypothetical protein